MISTPYKILMVAGAALLFVGAGYRLGSMIEKSSCDAGKAAAVSNNIDTKVKNDEIRNNRPDDAGIIDIMLNGQL